MTTGRLVSGEMPATPFLHQDYFRAVRLDPDQYRRLILRLHPSEPPNGGLDGGEGHEGGQGLGKVLEDLGEAAISPEPTCWVAFKRAMVEKRPSWLSRLASASSVAADGVVETLHSEN